MSQLPDIQLAAERRLTAAEFQGLAKVPAAAEWFAVASPCGHPIYPPPEFAIHTTDSSWPKGSSKSRPYSSSVSNEASVR